MKIAAGWLIIEDRDRVALKVDSNIRPVEKHFVETRGRSYLHSGNNCVFCSQGIGKHTRYVAACFYNDTRVKWEFGKDVYRKIKTYLNGDRYLNLLVTRIGSRRNTEYEIEQIGESEFPVNPDHARIIWQSVLNNLRQELTRSNYDTWLKDTEGISVSKDIFIVRVPSNFVLDWLKNRLLSLIENELASVIGYPVRVCFIIPAREMNSSNG